MFRGCLEITLQWNWLHLTWLEHLLLFITCTAKADPLIMIGWPCWWRGRPAEDGGMKSHQGKRKAVGQRLPFFQHNIKGRRWNCLETFSSHFLLSSVLRVINSFKEEAQGGGGEGGGLSGAVFPLLSSQTTELLYVSQWLSLLCTLSCHRHSASGHWFGSRDQFILILYLLYMCSGRRIHS